MPENCIVAAVNIGKERNRRTYTPTSVIVTPSSTSPFKSLTVFHKS
jgi:hypothetical protein